MVSTDKIKKSIDLLCLNTKVISLQFPYESKNTNNRRKDAIPPLSIWLPTPLSRDQVSQTPEPRIPNRQNHRRGNLIRARIYNNFLVHPVTTYHRTNEFNRIKEQSSNVKSFLKSLVRIKKARDHHPEATTGVQLTAATPPPRITYLKCLSAIDRSEKLNRPNKWEIEERNDASKGGDLGT